MTNLPTSIDETQKMLGDVDYVCGRGLATITFLSLTLGRPLFLEGEAGVGKTEIAKALAAEERKRAEHRVTLKRRHDAPLGSVE